MCANVPCMCATHAIHIATNAIHFAMNIDYWGEFWHFCHGPVLSWPHLEAVNKRQKLLCNPAPPCRHQCLAGRIKTVRDRKMALN